MAKSTINVLSFQDAMKASEDYSKRHLLLGNGFSISCIPSIFTYASLFKEADFSSIPEVQKVFSLMNTQDFELVINALEHSAIVVPAYNASLMKMISKIDNDAHKLKELLVETLAKNHPAFPSAIDERKYRACINFLAKFIDHDGKIYSLNYDLLLYWTLMYGLEMSLIKTIPNDGFGRETDFEDGEVTVSSYVTWQGDGKAQHQNVHYLHGALHLYDRGADVEKFTWIDKQKPLVDQARDALSEHRFPLFVAEGESNKKLEKIVHSGYLYHSFKSFSATMKVGTRNSNCCLFTYGVSFSENDQHILKKVSQGKVAHLFVSIYGQPDTETNLRIINSVEILQRKRNAGNLKVDFFDAASAKVWG